MARVTVSDETFYGNIYVRHLVFAHAGDVLTGHSHQFDHVTYLTHGAVEVSSPDRAPRPYSAPAFIRTPAGLMHEVVATEDDTQCCCMFAVRDPDGHVLDTSELAEP